MGEMFFVDWDPASTTPKMFLSFGDKQARKRDRGGARPPNVLHTTWCGKHIMLGLQKPWFS
jgi:hypothetical protein